MRDKLYKSTINRRRVEFNYDVEGKSRLTVLEGEWTKIGETIDEFLYIRGVPVALGIQNGYWINKGGPREVFVVTTGPRKGVWTQKLTAELDAQQIARGMGYFAKLLTHALE